MLLLLVLGLPHLPLELLLLLLGHALGVHAVQKVSRLPEAGDEKFIVVIHQELIPLIAFGTLLDLPVLHDVLEALVAEGHNAVLWLEVSMNDLADSVKVVEADKNELRNSSHERHWNPLVVIPLHNLKKIYAQDFEDHNEVSPVRSVVHKGIEQLDHLAVLGRKLPVDFPRAVMIILVVAFQALQPLLLIDVLSDDVEDLYLVVGCGLVAGGTLLHFQCDIGILMFHILGEPHCRELAPAQLLDNDVAIDQDFTEMHGVIASDLVLFDPFVLAVVSRISVPKVKITKIGK